MIALALVSLMSFAAQAEKKISFNFVGKELVEVIETYSKASGQKFVVDNVVRGKITILNNEEITLTEAFNHLSAGLALNGFTYVKTGDVMVIRNARAAQRDGIEVFTNTLPNAQPTRMVLWIVDLKHVSSAAVQSNVGRMMTSSYGEMLSVQDKNQIIVSDWSTAIPRVAEMIKNLDVKSTPQMSKFAAENKAWVKEFAKKKEQTDKIIAPESKKVTE